jgi:hypothetical protein
MAEAVATKAILVNIGYLLLGAHTVLVCANIMREQAHQINQPGVLPANAPALIGMRKKAYPPGLFTRLGVGQFMILRS